MESCCSHVGHLSSHSCHTTLKFYVHFSKIHILTTCQKAFIFGTGEGRLLFHDIRPQDGAKCQNLGNLKSVFMPPPFLMG